MNRCECVEVLDEPERRLHREILLAFPDLGAGPDRDWLQARASALGFDSGSVLVAARSLEQHGLVRYDAKTAAISVAWPFSSMPTPHRVKLAGARPVYAMCAIDALGIPLMFDRDADVSSRDPIAGKLVRVAFSGNEIRWDPPEAAVFLCTPRGEDPTASCCGIINVFHSTESGQAYRRAHPEVDGRMLSSADALEYARQRFGEWLV